MNCRGRRRLRAGMKGQKSRSARTGLDRGQTPQQSPSAQTSPCRRTPLGPQRCHVLYIRGETAAGTHLEMWLARPSNPAITEQRAGEANFTLQKQNAIKHSFQETTNSSVYYSLSPACTLMINRPSKQRPQSRLHSSHALVFILYCTIKI